MQCSLFNSNAATQSATRIIQQVRIRSQWHIKD